MKALRSFFPMVKYFHVNWLNDDNKLLNITSQHYNGYVEYSSKSAEILYVNFPYSGMNRLGLFFEYIDPDCFAFNGHTSLKCNTYICI